MNLPSPKISVIIPVYKSKEHIQETISSLQNQTLHDLEFIFIDDKGGDGSFDIAKAAASADSRIVCLENETNSGPGICRNKGIEAARGEYIAFVDADDYISLDFYEKLYLKAKETGALAVKSNVFEIKEDGSRVKSSKNEEIKKLIQKSPKSMLNLWYCEHWAGIYSRDLVIQTGARNCESARRDQDTCFQMMLMIHVRPDQFALEESVSYFYVQQPMSLVHKPKDAYYLEQMRLSAEFKINFMLQQPVSPEHSHYLARIINGRLTYSLDPAIKGIASINDLVKYIDYFSGVIKNLKFDGIEIRKYPAIHQMQIVNCDAATYLANRILSSDIPKADNLYTIVKRLEYHVSLLAQRPVLERKLRLIRLKLLFSYGKRRKRLKEKKSSIGQQLAILKAYNSR